MLGKYHTHKPNKSHTLAMLINKRRNRHEHILNCQVSKVTILMILTNAASANRDFYLIRHFGIKIVASSCSASSRLRQAVLLRRSLGPQAQRSQGSLGSFVLLKPLESLGPLGSEFKPLESQYYLDHHLAVSTLFLPAYLPAI